MQLFALSIQRTSIQRILKNCLVLQKKTKNTLTVILTYNNISQYYCFTVFLIIFNK